MRFLGRLRPATDGFLKCLVGIGYLQRDITHPIAMLSNVFRRRVVRRQRRRQQEIRLALTHRIRSSLTVARFRPAVSDLRKSESFAIEIGCLPGVANPEFDMMNAFKLEW